MDRHVEFLTQIARLVALYAHQPDDHLTEKAALRAARGAVKHGKVELSMEALVLRAGTSDVGEDIPNAPMLRDLFAALGVVRIHVAHHAPQAQIKIIAELLATAVRGEMTPSAFATAIAERPLNEIVVELAGAVTEAAPSAADPAVDAAMNSVVVEDVASNVDADVDEEAVVEAPQPTEALPPVAGSGAPAVVTGPLATRLPDVVAELVEASHRELFERLITSSEPGTLKRLLEPIQLCIEQEFRDGHVPVALQLLQAMFACVDLAVDAEMRRQFVVVMRRLTKPTLLRSIAMLYTDTPSLSASVEQVLSRFGEDGAEAVADRISCAPSAEWRALYAALLGRLPAARDAVVAMLDDDRPSVVERAIGLVAQLRFADAERVLGDQLGHSSVRVRQAAVKGLAVFPGSSFVADALLRAAEDASPEVRLAATVVLQGRREPRLASALVQRIDAEPELDVQLAIITALGRMALPEGVQKLVALAMPDQRLLRRRDISTLRLSAIEAMGEARTPQAMVALQKLLEDRDKDVRETAARLYTRARRQTSAGSMPAVSEP